MNCSIPFLSPSTATWTPAGMMKLRGTNPAIAYFLSGRAWMPKEARTLPSVLSQISWLVLQICCLLCGLVSHVLVHRGLAPAGGCAGCAAGGGGGGVALAAPATCTNAAADSTEPAIKAITSLAPGARSNPMCFIERHPRCCGRRLCLFGRHPFTCPVLAAHPAAIRLKRHLTVNCGGKVTATALFL